MKKIRCEECFSKLLIESVFPGEFGNLKFGERPDLQNDELNIGIEVTTAISQDEMNISGAFSDIISGTARNPEGSKKKIQKFGGHYDEIGIVSFPVKYRELNNIYSALEHKLNKLDNYKEYKNQHLLITDRNFIKTEELKEMLETFNKIQGKYPKKFSYIFLYLRGGTLYKFDMVSKVYSIYNVSNVIELSNKKCEECKLPKK